MREAKSNGSCSRTTYFTKRYYSALNVKAIDRIHWRERERERSKSQYSRQPCFLIPSNGCYVLPHPFVAGSRDYHFQIRRKAL